jgi:AcrR family transcriptional regulator
MAALMDTLRDQRRQQAVDEIAKVALDLFARDGFDATSVDDIAAAAGCSPRTFYRYFGCKEDVMFHDLAAMTELLDAALSDRLASGLGIWNSLTETLVALISRFEDTKGEETATQRMTLWLQEPALRARYMHYVTHAEDVVTACLRRHRGTTKKRDDLSPMVSAAVIGVYRATVATHYPSRTNWKLAAHLREALGLLGDGLAAKVAEEEPKASRSRKAAKSA